MSSSERNPGYNLLLWGILLDLVGMATYILPGLGEFFDVLWAPVSAYLLSKFYKGNVGKVAAVIGFVEEAVPGLDITPTFTLTWIYTRFFSEDSKSKLSK